MTTLTGSTEQKLRGTIDPPSFGMAMCGAVLQLSTVLYVWTRHTSAGACLGQPLVSDLPCNVRREGW